MNRELELYKSSKTFFKKLKAGAPMPDAMKGMAISEYTARLRNLAEENEHFSFDAYSSEKVFTPDVVLILSAHGYFFEVYKQEAQIAGMVRGAMDLNLLTSNDSILIEGTNGKLSYEAPDKNPDPRYFPHYIDTNNERLLVGERKGRCIDLLFDDLKAKKMPVHFYDGDKELLKKFHKYDNEVNDLIQLAKYNPELRPQFAETVANLINTNIERVSEYFVPAILKHQKNGRVWQIPGLLDYNVGVISEKLKENGISYLALAPKKIEKKEFK
ncbi:hypothetical protein KY312_02535 [Candidatus Woesearchaeota archaeon]|nr:hypothetical protein [Candidatus Woesearchaeota archaeon]